MKLYLVETFFWKDIWIEEQPHSRNYGTLSECKKFLEKVKLENLEHEPELSQDGMELTYSTDESRNCMMRILEINPIKNTEIFLNAFVCGYKARAKESDLVYDDGSKLHAINLFNQHRETIA